MQTKAKKFSRKLLALFMAIVMGLTCFSGVLSTYAASSNTEYTDADAEYNTLGWPMLSDEQVATAVLDYADRMLPALKDIERTLAKQVDGMTIGGVLKVNWDLNSRKVSLVFAASTLAEVTIKLGSVDELIETLNSVDSVLKGGLVGAAGNLGIDLGDIPSINLSAFNGMSRSKTSSCDILRGVFKLLYDNREPIVGKLLRGEFTLGLVDGSFNIYNTLGNLVGAPEGYKSNFVYNIVKSALLNLTGWFTDDEITAYNNGTKAFVLEEVLFEKLSSVVVKSMASVLVTYPDGTSSTSRYAKIKEVMDSEGINYSQAATKLGYDPNLVYSSEFVSADDVYANVLLFSYGSPDEKGLPTENTSSLNITTSSTILGIGLDALKIAWNTVLKDTVKLIHVNDFGDKGYGTNFDNAFYYWVCANGGWNTENPAANYSEENVKGWAEAVYADYKAESADEFLSWVEAHYRYDRSVVNNAKGNWSDIDSTVLFNKVRYSPLADLYFDMETGPLNLYLSQLGTPNLDSFFANSYENYPSLLSLVNDALVAAVKDLFVVSSNIDGVYPVLETANSSNPADVINALVPNAMAVLQYTADATDKNILNGFYNGDTSKKLNAENLEEAMLPFLISCIGNIWLNGNGTLAQLIHPSDWDKCNDAEDVAFIALREYLSYVQSDKNYDALGFESDGKYNATLEGTIYPMARDAIAYVIQASVPITDKSGNAWTVETSSEGDGMDLYEVLNSVVCYYAGRYKLDTGYTNGVANLLGVVDANGNDLVKRSNTLWQNIDVIANKFFPILAQFQGTAQFDSEQFILDDLIRGILDVGNKDLHGGTDGITSFLTKLFNGMNMDPLAKTPIHISVYNVIRDLFNGIFGARYTPKQSYTEIIPAASTTHPIDDLLQVGVIGAKDTGIVQKLLCNVPEFAGCVNYPDSVMPGLTYIVTVLNGFFGFIPEISNHVFEPVTASIDKPSFTGVAQNDTVSTSLNVKNNCHGVNNAYRDPMTGDIVQLDRYFINVKDIKVNNQDPSAFGIDMGTKTAKIDPLGTFTVPLTITSKQSLATSLKYTVTYDIVDSKNRVLYENLEVNTFQYLDPKQSWKEVIYADENIDSSTGLRRFSSKLSTSDGETTLTDAGFSTRTTRGFGTKNRLNVLYPTEFILTSDDYSEVNTFAYRFNNNSNGVGSGTSTMDGMYVYDIGTVYNDATGSNVSVGQNNAIPVFDENTGDLLKYGLYDVRYKGSETWDRKGYTDAELAGLKNVEELRTHVAFTLEEAKNNGMIQAYHYNPDLKIYEYIYLKPGNSGYAYNSILTKVSMRGPIDGFVLNSEQLSQGKSSHSYHQLMWYDGQTAVEPGEYKVNICFYATAQSATVTDITFIAMDVSGRDALGKNYQSALDVVANYQSKDFSDSSIVEKVQEDLLEALKTYGTPISPANYKSLSDTTAMMANTTEVTSEYGDPAYVPFSTANDASMPAIIKAKAFKNDSGVYFLDENLTIPIYSNVALTSADVKDGRDAAGVEVIADSSGNYFVKNTPVYTTEWDLETYEAPWRRPTGEQKKDVNGNLIYARTQFAFFNSESVQVSERKWDAKYAIASYVCVPNSGELGSLDNRGAYSQTSDFLAYTLDYVYDNAINFGEQLLTNVSYVRSGLDATNFEMASYNQAINTAKMVESNYTIDVTYAYDNAVGEKETNSVTGLSFSNYYSNYAKYSDATYKYYSDTKVTAKTRLTSMQVDEYIKLFDSYMAKMGERGYMGDKLEAEILCASGNAYNKLTATPAVYGDDGAVQTPATVKKGSAAVDPKYGSWSSDGTLVNLENGEKAYSDASWTSYITALAEAVSLAQYGNGDYAYKEAGYYNADDKDGYDAQVTRVYDVDSVLQIAENALTPAETVLVTVGSVEGATVQVNGTDYSSPMAFEIGNTVTIKVVPAEGYEFDHMMVNGVKVVDNPYVVTLRSGQDDINVQPVVKSSGITVSGTIKIATNLDGTASTVGIGGIRIMAGDQVVATSAGDGSFKATVPAGTTELVITGDTTIDRTVTLSGKNNISDAEIPVVICDYNKDGFVNAADNIIFSSALVGEYSLYCDLNGDSFVNASDNIAFASFFGNKIEYAPITLD